MATPKGQNKYTEQNILNRAFDEDFGVINFQPKVYDPTSDTLSSMMPANPLNLKPYDYVSRTANSDTETWTFKSGGSGGTTTNTVVIVYTDATLSEISTITKT